MRRAWTIAALAVPGLLGLGAGAPAALAADDCPNAAVRAQQSATQLPNCFAYEKVTPNDKNGSTAFPDSPIAPDGSAVSIWATAHMADDDPGLQQLGAGYRGPDGWTFKILSNSSEWGKLRVSGTVDVASWNGTSDDLKSLLFTTQHPLDPGDLGDNEYGMLMATEDIYIGRADGTTEWVSKPASGVVPAGAQQAGSAAQPWGNSPDMSRVIFDTSRVLDPAVDATVRPHVWLYQPGKPLEVLDRLPDGTLSTATQPQGQGSTGTIMARPSTDARRVVFLSESLYGAQHVYARIDAGTPQARTVLVSADAAGTPCPSGIGFDHITEDGRYVRFRCGAKLTSDAPTSGGAYVRDLDSGAVFYDEPHVDRGSQPVVYRLRDSWTRPEGRYRVEPGTFAEGWLGQLVRVDLTTGQRDCVSCAPTGPLGGSPAWGGYGIPGPWSSNGGAGKTAIGMVTPDGDVAFRTAQQLVPEDTNAFADVYLWKDGKQYLLSSGDAPSDVLFGGVSLDGSTISFSTVSSLVPEDRDGGARDVYVVRRDGGFFRAAEPGECKAGCQGPADAVTAPLRPLSVDFTGDGNVVDDSLDAIALSGSRTVTGTSLKVKVKLPAAGRVSVSGNGLQRTSKTVKGSASATLSVKLSARSQRLLKKRSSLRLKATVRYVPASGSTQSTRVTLTFKRKTAAKKKGTSRSVAAATSGKAAR